MKKILCIHQGYELYGSDRTFMSCVGFLRQYYPEAAIEVLLPREGALSNRMREQGFNVVLQDLWVLRKGYGIAGLILRALRFPAFLLRALRRMKSADLVYVNTCVIVDYMVAARFHGKTVIHVHEVPEGVIRKVIRLLALASGAGIIFNSKAACDNLALPTGFVQAVVHNGVDVPMALEQANEVSEPRQGKIKILMIGRLNSWKGQDLLLDALALLPRELRNGFQVIIKGDVFENAPYRDQLVEKIRVLDLGHIVELEGFELDPTHVYTWCDLIVVPSRKPEPFGLVAIEAMAQAKPVLAARHGGLLEIVVEPATGWFHNPNDPDDLARQLVFIASRRLELPAIGAEGRKRYRQEFTLDAFKRRFIGAVSDMIPMVEGGSVQTNVDRHK